MPIFVIFVFMEIKLTYQNFDETINKASGIIKSGGVTILPFDTVYGFVCDPRNNDALQKIYELKKRPEMKTIGLAASNIEAVEFIADVNNEARVYIKEKTPGKYTFIMKKLKDDKSDISDFCVQDGTMGVRIPDSKLILSVAKKCGGLIAQTSANISGQGNCYSIIDIKNQYDNDVLNQIDLIVDGGDLEKNGASKLINLTGDTPVEIKRQ